MTYSSTRGKICQPRILYPMKLSFKNKGKKEVFPDKQKQKECIASRPALQGKLKEVLQAESM